MAVTSYTYNDGTLRWRFVIDLPGPDGGRRQAKRSGFRTADEATAAENALRSSHGRAAPAAHGTVAAALRAWVEACETNLEETSSGWYSVMVETYVVPYVGDLPMTSFDVARREKLYRDLRRNGGKKGQGLSDSTIRGVHKTLSAAFTYLKVKHEDVRVPKPNRRTGRHGVWTEEQSDTFLFLSRMDRLFAAWALALVCGLRRGELAGLRWRDIDLVNGVIYIRKQRTLKPRGGVLEKTPKGSSEREIAIGPLMVAILQVWWDIAAREKAEAGERWMGGDRVFTWDRGKNRGREYHPSYFTHRFPDLCALAGVPRIALHDARHTSASIAATNGVDIKTLQQRMGHSDAKILTEVYLHLMTTASRAAAVTTESVMLRRSVLRAA